MKNLLTILIAFSTAFHAFGQKTDLFGKYWADSTHFVRIGPSDTLEFHSLHGCCLLTDIYAIGTFTLTDSTLLVETFPPKPNMTSSHKITGRSSDHDEVKLQVTSSNSPVPFCNIYIMDTLTNEPLATYYTDEEGIFEFFVDQNHLNEDPLVRFSVLGMDSYSVPLRTLIGKSALVQLKPYRVIQNEKLEFEIFIENGTTSIIGPILPVAEKQEMTTRDKMRTAFTHWPWDWNFNYHSHEHIPRRFEKK